MEIIGLLLFLFTLIVISKKILAKIWENRSQWFETIVVYAAIFLVIAAILFLFYVLIFANCK